MGQIDGVRTVTPGTLTKQDILEAIESNRSKLRSLGVRNLALFGSFVRECQTPESDIDLLVEFDAAEKTYDNFVGLADFLEELLQRPVELVTTESLSPYIGPRILDEAEYARVA